MQKISSLILITLVGCQRSVVRKHLEFIEPLASPILTLDPACAHDTDSMQVVREIFEPLFKITPKGNIEPHLISKYDISRNQKVFTFYLKPNIFFHNGKELLAKDVKWTIERNLNLPFNNTKAKNIFKYLAKIERISRYAVKFVFDHPKPYFIPQLTTLTSAPIAKDTAPLNKEITYPNQMIGTGPYRIEQYFPTSLIQFKSFENYHGQKPKIQYVKRPLISDPQLRLNLFIKKKVDKITLPRTIIDSIKNNKKFSRSYKLIPRLSTTYLAVGLDSYPILKDQSFRKLLLGWIPLNLLSEEITSKTVTLAKNFVPYKIPNYTYSHLLPVPHSKNLNLILRQKGYSIKNPLLLNLYFRSDNLNNQRIAEIIAREWNQCPGLKIKLNPCQRYKIHVAQNTQKMDLFMTRWLVDYPDPQHGLECFISNNPQNYCGLSNKNYDFLLRKATQAPNQKKRYRWCEKAEKYLLDQAIILPLTHDSEIQLIQLYIEGFKTNPIFDLSYNTLSFQRGSESYKN